jgi:hypothetical protein
MLGVKTARNAVSQRLNGKQPSRTKSTITAAVAGGAVAAAVYKSLRSG